MLCFHNDKINWGDFTLRKTLYSPDQDPQYLQGMDANTVFNMPIHELEQRFNNQGNQQIKKKYDSKKHSWIVNTVYQLCKRAHLSMMSVVMFKTDKLGASTVPESEIDISRGTIKALSRPELTALIAHEISHSIIKKKHLNVQNKESYADIIGAKLSSKNDMIDLIKFFAKRLSSNGDQEHYSDQKRIKELNDAFKVYDAQKEKINDLKSKLVKSKQNNERLHNDLKKRKIAKLTAKLKKARRSNQILKDRVNHSQNHMSH